MYEVPLEDQKYDRFIYRIYGNNYLLSLMDIPRDFTKISLHTLKQIAGDMKIIGRSKMDKFRLMNEVQVRIRFAQADQIQS
jgi:hypothetical protein